MARIKFNELSLQRVYNASVRRINDIPHAIAWRSSEIARVNSGRLDTFAGRHAGSRCFIMGNGPSISRMELEPLKNEFTFGLNRIYLLFDKIPFVPSFYVSVNELVLKQFTSDIQALPMPKFLNWNCRSHFDWNDTTVNFLRLALPLGDDFCGEITAPISGGGTVTYVALQVAYFMGFDEVILIGVDHNFVDKGIPNKTVVRTAERDQNHFDPRYFPKGSRWQLPDLHRSELAFALARKAFEADSRQILDATVDGQCMVFEKVDFSTLF